MSVVRLDGFMRRSRKCSVAAVRLGVGSVVVVVIVTGEVEMDVSRGDDELNDQRGERKARSPSLAQPEPAHRRIPPADIACRPDRFIAAMLQCNNIGKAIALPLLRKLNTAQTRPQDFK
jgi:hypothetical protein